jgi:4-carboxymuconolactone decarboxylase
VLAPKFTELNDYILFGDVWSREDKLSPRDQCIVTVTVLMTKGIFDNSLKYHLSNAKNHGVTAEEMVETITQAALYVGWPNEWAVFPLAKEVYSEDDTG